ncbi:MAG: coproporphyrinogen III oxidase family protein, partial [Oscillospiraceae bacterium]|nr:coproporphyrinogen III oxidase family protein [Oscillospiraceae bacterium]
EISNFCLSGYHSRHNTIYWKLEDYLGIGPGAHSCMAGQRFYYPRDLKTFIAEGKTVADGTVDADDYIMLSLRLASGLNFETLKEKWSLVPNDYVKRKLEIYKNGGFIEYDGTTVSLTPQGFLAENIIASDIMGNVTEI